MTDFSKVLLNEADLQLQDISLSSEGGLATCYGLQEGFKISLLLESRIWVAMLPVAATWVDTAPDRTKVSPWHRGSDCSWLRSSAEECRESLQLDQQSVRAANRINSPSVVAELLN